MSRHLGKFEKMWNSPCIAIEDPFDLSHNLGAGISRKMNMFIKTAFIRTRELFGIPSPKIPKFHSKIPIEQLKVCFCKLPSQNKYSLEVMTVWFLAKFRCWYIFQKKIICFSKVPLFDIVKYWRFWAKVIFYFCFQAYFFSRS